MAAVPGVAQRFSFERNGLDSGLKTQSIELLYQDRTGYLWVGTQHGLYRYDGAHFLSFDMRDGLPSARIESLYETADHVLWAGTSVGLARRQGPKFQYVDVGRPIEIAGTPRPAMTGWGGCIGRLWVKFS